MGLCIGVFVAGDLIFIWVEIDDSFGLVFSVSFKGIA